MNNIAPNISLLFWLNTSKFNKKGTYSIYMRITINKDRKEIATNLSVPHTKWNQLKECITGKTPDVLEMNRKLDQLKTRTLKIYNELTEQNIPISAELIKNKLVNPHESFKTVLDAFTYHNGMLKERVGIDICRATNTRYNTLKNRISDFIKEKFNRKEKCI